GELPDLLVRQKAAEGRHAVRASFANAGPNVLDRVAVDPDVVHQRRAHTAAAIEVATDTVHGAEKLLAGSDLFGIVHYAPRLGALIGDGLLSAWREWHEGDLRLAAGRIGRYPFRTFSLLRVASADRRREQRTEQN